jgi:hypothetical protein
VRIRRPSGARENGWVWLAGGPGACAARLSSGVPAGTAPIRGSLARILFASIRVHSRLEIFRTEGSTANACRCVFMAFIGHFIVRQAMFDQPEFKPQSIDANRSSIGEYASYRVQSIEVWRKYSRLRVAICSGPSSKSNTSTERYPWYPTSPNAARIGSYSTAPKPGPFRLQSFA